MEYKEDQIANILVEDDDNPALEEYDPKFYVEYEYWNDYGDCRPHISQENEKFETIDELIEWIVGQMRRDSDFKVLYIKKVNYIPSYIPSNEKQHIHDLVVQRFKEAEEKAKRKAEELEKQKKLKAEEDAKRQEEQERQLYLRLKRKFENG